MKLNWCCCWKSGECVFLSSWPLQPDPLRPKVVVPVRVPSIGHRSSITTIRIAVIYRYIL